MRDSRDRQPDGRQIGTAAGGTSHETAAPDAVGGTTLPPNGSASTFETMDPPRSRKAAGPGHSTFWQFLLTLLAIVVFFVGSTLYSQHLARRLDEDAASIAVNASPSIEALSVARGDASQAELAVTRAVEAAPDNGATERAAAESALTGLHASLARYLALPFYAGEREHWNEVDQALRAFEETVTVAFVALQEKHTDTARSLLITRLRPATARLDASLQFLVGFNAREQHRMGEEIPRLRKNAARTAYVLDGASAVLAAVLIALAVIEARRRQQLLAHLSDRLEAMVTGTARITAALGRRKLRPVLTAIVEEASRVARAEYAALGFVNDAGRPFDSFVFHGISPAEAKAIGHFPRPVGVLGQIIAEGRGLRVADVRKHPSFRGLPEGHPPMGPFLGVPIRRDGNGRGNLYVARAPGAPPFSERDEHLVELFAAQAAASTENARLYEELDEQRTRAQLLSDISSRLVDTLDYQTTLKDIANAVCSPSFVDVCAIDISDDSGELVSRTVSAADPAWRLLLNEHADHDANHDRKGGRPPNDPVVRALLERRTVRFAVEAETRGSSERDSDVLSEIPLKFGVAIPLVGHNHLLGVITFMTFADHSFDDSTVAFAEEVARRAALSIDNALLHQRTCRAVESRSDVLAIVSHDLRNPLNAVRLTADLLRRNGAADERRRGELADRLTRATDVMLRLISDLLDASKIESGTLSVEPKPEPIGPMFADALETVREVGAARSISIHVDIDNTLFVICDRTRILQVLSNLLNNALKFTPDEGSLTISAHRIGAEVHVRVSDTGPGIAEAERERVFDRYWQARHTRRAGAGLGLFIVRGIVEAHGGRAWVEAAPGGGACLCFSLQARASEEELERAAP